MSVCVFLIRIRQQWVAGLCTGCSKNVRGGKEVKMNEES